MAAANESRRAGGSTAAGDIGLGADGTYGVGAVKASFNERRNAWLRSIEADRALHRTAVHVLHILSEYFNQNEFKETGRLVAFPTHETLAGRARISDRMVRKHLKTAREAGHVVVKGGGDGKPSRYTAMISDRNSGSGLNPAGDNFRPELPRIQTGTPASSDRNSGVPTTSETSETSEGRARARPGASRPSSKVEREDSPLKGGPLYRVGQEIETQDYGSCTVIKIHRRNLELRDANGNHQTMKLYPDGSLADDVPF